LPHWLTAAILLLNATLFVLVAFDDERKLAASPLAADYASYRERTGMSFPKFSPAAPGR
jgi:protein-S-isoprenylcysteine O-methyltransferase Ste14